MDPLAVLSTGLLPPGKIKLAAVAVSQVAVLFPVPSWVIITINVVPAGGVAARVKSVLCLSLIHI